MGRLGEAELCPPLALGRRRQRDSRIVGHVPANVDSVPGVGIVQLASLQVFSFRVPDEAAERATIASAERGAGLCSSGYQEAASPSSQGRSHDQAGTTYIYIYIDIYIDI